jgi:hypothetical protein
VEGCAFPHFDKKQEAGSSTPLKYASLRMTEGWGTEDLLRGQRAVHCIRNLRCVHGAQSDRKPGVHMLFGLKDAGRPLENVLDKCGGLTEI